MQLIAAQMKQTKEAVFLPSQLGWVLKDHKWILSSRVFMQQLLNNTWGQGNRGVFSILPNRKKNKTLNYSSIGTFSTANISMRPDAPFNKTVPVAWQ